MDTSCDYTTEIKSTDSPYCEECPACKKPNVATDFTTCFEDKNFATCSAVTCDLAEG